MPAPLPKEVRSRFARLIVEGVTGRRGRKIRRNGAATVAPMGRPSGPGKRAPHGGIFRASAMQGPDITLFDLRDALAAVEGVTVRRSTIAGFSSVWASVPRQK